MQAEAITFIVTHKKRAVKLLHPGKNFPKKL
jgi:hypothetical protein